MYRLHFDIPESGDMRFTSPGLDITCTSGRLECRIYTDFRETPLVLLGDASPKSRAEIILMSHRAELRIDGEIIDEEWPAGKILFSPENPSETTCTVGCDPYSPPRTETPCVISTFTGADGWRPSENVFVGDCMPYVDDGRYHVLYLKDRRHHHSKWNFGAHQWEHISTDDFETWQIHPMAVEITDPIEGSICTGSWIKKGSLHYLFYTVRMTDGSPARICRSISSDGYHFEKDSAFVFLLSERYHGPSARDPKVILGEDGMYHMFLTTSLLSENKGCLAHLISADLDSWQEAAEPIFINADDNQPECPDYFKYGDHYYLVYSLYGSALYMYSKEPFGNWQIPADPAIPCEAVPKAGIWKGKIIFTGFNRMQGYAGTLAFRTAHAAENGEMIFE